jgi:signal transduction histidine kinase
MEMKPTDCRRVLLDAVETIRPVAEAKEIALKLALGEDPAIVIGDSARLQRAFWNLLSNAVKFTPKGGSVDLALERTDSELEINVADNGVGIETSLLARIFERFLAS